MRSLRFFGLTMITLISFAVTGPDQVQEVSNSVWQIEGVLPESATWLFIKVKNTSNSRSEEFYRPVKDHFKEKIYLDLGPGLYTVSWFSSNSLYAPFRFLSESSVRNTDTRDPNELKFILPPPESYMALSTQKSGDSSVQVTLRSPEPCAALKIKIKNLDLGQSENLFFPSCASVFSKTLYLGNGPGKYEIDIFFSSEQNHNGAYSLFKYGKLYLENLDPRNMHDLLPTASIESDAPEILDLANQLTSGLRSDQDKSQAIHDWVSSHIHYDVAKYVSSVQGTLQEDTALRTLQTRKGVCAGYAYLTAALHRAAGIPAKVVMGYALWPGIKLADLKQPNHDWNEVLIDGQWIPQDTTWDSGTYDPKSQIFEPYPVPSLKYFEPDMKLFSADHIKSSEVN